MSDDSFPTESQKAWDIHALAVGRIAMAWNAFQEAQAEIFSLLFEVGDKKLALASWHSLVSDVAQQEMLRAVAKEKLGSDSNGYQEVNWMLEKAKQVLSHQRNFGIHTPFMILHDRKGESTFSHIFITGTERRLRSRTKTF